MRLRVTIHAHSPHTVPRAVDDYRIQKDRLEITLTLIGGEQLRGRIFVQPLAYARHRREEPIDLFNDPDPFFPLEVDGGEMLLIAKDRVVEVSGIKAAEDDDVRSASARMALLEVKLTGGITHFGSMRLELPSGRGRVLDHLNGCAERFLTLYTDRDVRLVNRAMIERVRPLD
jgi:hypothetical protein